jgi:hypothetical protein
MTSVITLFCLAGRALELGRELLGKWGYKRIDEPHYVILPCHDNCYN